MKSLKLVTDILPPVAMHKGLVPYQLVVDGQIISQGEMALESLGYTHAGPDGFFYTLRAALRSERPKPKQTWANLTKRIDQ